MRGLIQYIAPFDTPAASPYDHPDFYNRSKPWAGSFSAGDTVEIYLKPYEKKDLKSKDNKKLSQTPSGVSETRYFGSSDIWLIAMGKILRDLTVGKANEYASYNAFNKAMVMGVEAVWYPDYDLDPAEYYTCTMDKRKNPRRIGKVEIYQFSFDLIVMSSAQFPSTVPAFT